MPLSTASACSRSWRVVKGITASSIASEPYQRAGRAIMAATGTVQRCSCRAPQMTSAMPSGRRTVIGTGTAAQVPDLPALSRRTSIQVGHGDGVSAKETATMAAVAHRAIASARHSRRTRNHRRPMPGVILVRSTKDHVAGHRNPSTIATASRREMLPPMISAAATTTPPSSSSRPVSQATQARRIAVQAATNMDHGSRPSGQTSCAKAGEYGKALTVPQEDRPA